MVRFDDWIRLITTYAAVYPYRFLFIVMQRTLKGKIKSLFRKIRPGDARARFCGDHFEVDKIEIKNSVALRLRMQIIFFVSQSID